MNLEDEHGTLKPDNTSSSDAAWEHEILERPMAASEEVKPATPMDIEVPESVEVAEQQPELHKVPPVSAIRASELAESTASEAAESALPEKPESFFRERPAQLIDVAPQVLRRWTHRDVLSSEQAR